MKEILTSIPGFSLGGKNRNQSKKSSNKKLSAAAAIQQVREGIVDLETPDSVVGQVNLRLLLNKATFAKLPPLYQFKLLQLLPEVDNVVEPRSRTVRLSQSSLNNEFFAKACQEWREQLVKGELLPEAVQRAKADEEKERLRLDPWKAKHFEPIWGKSKHDYSSWIEEEEDVNEDEQSLRAKPSRTRKRSATSQQRPAEEEEEQKLDAEPAVVAPAAAAEDSPKRAKISTNVTAADEDSKPASETTDEIDMARKVQSEIEESELMFVQEEKKLDEPEEEEEDKKTEDEEEEEEREIDDEMDVGKDAGEEGRFSIYARIQHEI